MYVYRYVLFVLSYSILRTRYNTTKIVVCWVCGNERAWTTVAVECRNVCQHLFETIFLD